MGGFFGVASKHDCVLELFYGVDYHSHLGTRRGGMAVYGKEGFNRAIHNIENSPFRTKFERDVEELKGNLGIGCISDYEPQPLLLQSHLGSFAITTIGKINNQEEILEKAYKDGRSHFLEMSGGQINATELIGSLICRKSSIEEGIRYAQEMVDGSLSLLIMTKDGIYAARDLYGRTPVVIGKKDGAYCVSFENFAYLNLGYNHDRELGPGEIAYITPESVETLVQPRDKMRICSFLWVYYGYPTSSYEGVNVEEMRYNCGSMLARRDGDSVHPDIVAGVPDSGVAHAIGYSNESGIPYARPFIKYTPTWPRSFMPTNQSQRDLIARMKLIPVQALIENKRLLLIDDSIVRGTQLRETTEFLYRSGAKEVHVRPACPPLVFGCKYLNFSRSKSDMELITRRIIREQEGDNCPEEVLEEYTNPDSCRYAKMIEEIRRIQNFTTLRFHRLDDLLASIGLEPCKVCTYCFSGKE
ncbi:amidophosphoribosyltransferase [Mediterraneibacter catenae]|jgi:amidophosphoribosyltransferase|uniref:Amidophosphoribosyltransferase n=1 Tax=Mediterraneibacter catenae TaxID=2594882 RepID=A0A5M9I1V5_9FIRM|nr:MULTISPECIES: amidophosphoribosyltransferase [Mediterraneibacter]OUO29836.1 amidophosphoribosyltransferase [Lachnoclostridium sp. An298]KAA8501235.1 amidophosphoribosyltransferase [Mediterraneibacter catenae]MCF2569254.1 amidophosphoribosyltransferase [Mediterraneibacter glycyrrhizinilyticus]MDN0043697.1 amidophosphoribosyltransferase [Mediterraneibacter glycyrrhizinilyticus]MDN0060770.1 amidophosphoribosyltransferase [Mediterraneibacter glycyrrhizinilyticus]